MRTLRKLSSVGAMLFLLALFAPLGAGARPPQLGGMLALAAVLARAFAERRPAPHSDS